MNLLVRIKLPRFRTLKNTTSCTNLSLIMSIAWNSEHLLRMCKCNIPLEHLDAYPFNKELNEEAPWLPITMSTPDITPPPYWN